MAEAGLLEVVETVELVEFEIPCDGIGPKHPCGEAATWIGIPSCCAVATLRCDGHRRALEAMFALLRAAGKPMVHLGVCKRDVESMRWEPLRGGA